MPSATGPIASVSPPDADSSPPATAARATPCREHFSAGDFERPVHARDLGSLERSIRSARGRAMWNEEMVGATPRDRLGRTLPTFASREQILTFTGHPNPSEVTVVGMRRLPGTANRWVAIAASRDVRLALIEVAANGSVELLARTTRPVVPTADWRVLPEDFAPTSVDDDGATSQPIPTELDERTEVIALDLATFDLGPGERAIGLRSKRFEGYSGGGGEFESLTLLRQDGDVLAPVLDVPIGSSKMLAGDWNADQTRQHDLFVTDLMPVRMRTPSGGAERSGCPRVARTWVAPSTAIGRTGPVRSATSRTRSV